TGGGTVQSAAGIIGNESSGTGIVTVAGTASLWESTETLSVGYQGNATLSITDGGHVENLEGIVGDHFGTGLVTVDGDGSLLQTDHALTVGKIGEGVLEITGGGQVFCNEGLIGVELGSTGHVTVDGDGSRWDDGDFFVGG